jgi:putative membrane protein
MAWNNDVTLVTRGEAERIASAIAQAERKTSGEIVAIIAPASSGYYDAPLLWAAVAALLLPWPFIAWTWWPVQTVFGLQIAFFIVLAVAFNWRPIRVALVPRSVKHARARRRAREQFLVQNLHTTSGRTGVLIFVSAAERYVELIADAGIDARVPPGEWKRIVDALTARIAEQRAGDGFVEAIDAVASRLAEHFPPGTVDPNELPNHLIVLPGE